MARPVRRWWAPSALLAVLALAGACTSAASSGGPAAEPPALRTPAQQPHADVPADQPLPSAVGHSSALRVASGGSWVGTGCAMFPANNYWHARVDSLPTLGLTSPAGASLADLPGAGTPEDPLRLRAGLMSADNRTINWVDSDDDLEWVRVVGDFVGDSEYTAVETVQVGPLAWATGGLIRHRIPETVLTEGSSTDDHALFVDTDSCRLNEYIRWERVPGLNTGRSSTAYDLATNERRLSVRPGWSTAPTNSPSGALDSPVTPVNPLLGELDQATLEQPRRGTSASGGSGMPASAGIVRLDEVFATPGRRDPTVAADASIDHALQASVPGEHITAKPTEVHADTVAPFTWPATRSDGCGGSFCDDGSPGSDHHFPMGSRLRLKAEHCSGAGGVHPQAAVVIRAMCEHGVVVTDRSDRFSITTERAPEKWERAARNDLEQLTLRDFEIVDMDRVAVVDADALWQGALEWFDARYGFGSVPPGGWYQGTFWRAVVSCERSAPDAGSSRGDCVDPLLARVDRAVNGPDWMAVR